jgi:hypothetical protein
MIIVRGGGVVRLVRQVDHQTQCGIMARAWGNAAFARPEPFGPLIEVAECHDDGWRGWDAAPQVDDEGVLVNFPDLDRAIHAPMYAQGIAAAAARGPRVGLLASMHGQGLYEKRMGLDGPCPPRAGRPECELRFLSEQERLQAELRARIGGGEALTRWAWAGYRLLQAWDVLSLYVCWRGLGAGEQWVLPQVPTKAGDDDVNMRLSARDPATCVVHPWPFAGDRLDLSVSVRRITDIAYPNDDALRTAIDAAAPRILVLSAVPESDESAGE